MAKIGVVLPRKTAASPLERIAFASVLAKAVPDRGSATEFVERRWGGDRGTAMLMKAIATPGETESIGWGAEVAGTAHGEFLASLEGHSAIAAISGRGSLSAFDGANEKTHPNNVGGVVPMQWVEQGEPIPVQSFMLGTVMLRARTMAMIATFTRTLLKQSNAEAIFAAIFRETAGVSMDAAYLSTASQTTARHAGLLNGLTPIAGESGGDEIAMKKDLVALFDAIAPGGSGEAALVMSPRRALAFGVNFPDQAEALTVLPSRVVPDDRVIAIDPRALVHGFGGVPDLYISNEAILHMNDDPDEIVSDTGPTTADPVLSVFQTDAVAMRCILDVGFAKRRTNAVAYVEGASW